MGFKDPLGVFQANELGTDRMDMLGRGYGVYQATAGQGNVEAPAVAGAAVIRVLQVAGSEMRLGGKAGDRFYGALYTVLRGLDILLEKVAI